MSLAGSENDENSNSNNRNREEELSQQQTSKRKLSVEDDDERASKRPKAYTEQEEKLSGSIVEQHYNEIADKGLAIRSTSKIFFMRNFNNWIKSMLIRDYLCKVKSSLPHGRQLNVLDLCSGKGGDLLKWQKGKINHLICSDIAQLSVEQCEARYNKIASRQLYKAEFIACDATRNRLREFFM